MGDDFGLAWLLVGSQHDDRLDRFAPALVRHPNHRNIGNCRVAVERALGHRLRSLMGTFGRVEIAVPRARLDGAEGKTTEWRSSALRAYQRRTKHADSLIAGAYLAGTNTRRVRRALS